MTTWTAEDDKLVTLAKGARTRVDALSGAALRDTTGRTYANAEVVKPFLEISAIELTVGQAIASGATGIEAVVLCTEGALESKDARIVHEFAGPATPIYVVNLQGERTDI